MLLAIKDGFLVKPTVGTKAICPSCKEEVIAKCGEINIWHWSHKNDTECDTWSEPETMWHYQWKTLFPIDCVEVVIGKHRADVKYMHKVIEFQHSNISSDEIREREVFYDNMIWVVDAKEFQHNMYLQEGFCKWKWLHKSWKYAQKPIFFQFSYGDMVRVKKWTYKGFYYEQMSSTKFKQQYLNLRIVYDDWMNKMDKVI